MFSFSYEEEECDSSVAYTVPDSDMIRRCKVSQDDQLVGWMDRGKDPGVAGIRVMVGRMLD